MNYKSKRWKRTREAILRRDGYMCQVSKRYGRHLPANTVHHIFPANQFPEYQWEPWNLVAVDQSVHNSLHIRDTDELTDAGRELMERTARHRGMDLGAITNASPPGGEVV